MQNLSVGYDATRYAANLTATRNVSGNFVLGGFTPALETIIRFDFLMLSYGFNGPAVSILHYDMGGYTTNYQSYLKLGVQYYNETGTVQTEQTNSPIWGVDSIPWVSYSLHWYSNGTFHYAYHDDTTTWVSGWNCTHQDYNYTKPLRLSPAWIFLNWNPSSSAEYETEYSMYVRNLTQTINVTSDDVYADVPSCSYTAMGFDGIYPDAYANVTPLLTAYDVTASWFFDMGLETSQWTESEFAALLDLGHEFAIHTNAKDTWNTSELADFNRHFTYLTNMANNYSWGSHSFAWSSLGNDYNWTYNDYAWANYLAIGRKTVAHPYVNQGHLGAADNVPNLIGCADRGVPFMGYCHRLNGSDPDISYTNFTALLNGCQNNSMNIVGYIEYWSRYAAPWLVSGTIDNISDDIKIVKISYANLSIKNKVEVSVSLTALGGTDTSLVVVYNPDGGEESFVRAGGYIIFNATEGWYKIEFPGSGGGPGLAPVASFEYTITEFRTVSFIDTSVGAIFTRTWNFGDGVGSTQRNPVHEYLTDGTYTVTLTVADALGRASTQTETIDVSGTDDQWLNEDATLGIPYTDMVLNSITCIAIAFSMILTTWLIPLPYGINHIRIFAAIALLVLGLHLGGVL